MCLLSLSQVHILSGSLAVDIGIPHLAQKNAVYLMSQAANSARNAVCPCVIPCCPLAPIPGRETMKVSLDFKF